MLIQSTENRLRRRADWRFLLPDPRPSWSVCFGGGQLARAVRAVSEHVLTPAEARRGSCDLAVAVQPNAAVRRAAWDALQPGGWCYTEWYIPAPGSGATVRQSLSSVGFENVTCYVAWPWPPVRYARYWVPLEAPGALNYFLNSRPTPVEGGPASRLVRRVGRGIWGTALWAGLHMPICAIARKGGGAPTTGLCETARASWEQWGFGPPPERVSRLLLTGGYRLDNKVVSLLFAEPDPRPRLAVKQARVARNIADLEAEATCLAALHAGRPGGLPGAPRVVFRQAHSSGLLVGETALTGVPLLTLAQPERYHELAAAATNWQIQLAGRPGPAPRASWWQRLVGSTLARFEAQFGSALDPQLLHLTRLRLDRLGALPLVPEQRDFSPWNVLIDAAGQLAVLDWESAELLGLPATDLIYFLTYLAFFLDGAYRSGRFRESYRASLDPQTPTGRIRAECLATYARALGLHPSALQPLALLTWLIHSHSEYTRLAQDVAGAPLTAHLKSSTFVSFLEEELRATAD